MSASQPARLVRALSAAGYWPGPDDLAARVPAEDRVHLRQAIARLDHRALLALLWVACALWLYHE